MNTIPQNDRELLGSAEVSRPQELVFRFLDLPLEIRLMIYEKLPRQIIHTTYFSSSLDGLSRQVPTAILVTKAFPTAILRVSRGINAEAAPIVKNTLDNFFSDWRPKIIMYSVFREFMNDMPPADMAAAEPWVFRERQIKRLEEVLSRLKVDSMELTGPRQKDIRLNYQRHTVIYRKSSAIKVTSLAELRRHVHLGPCKEHDFGPRYRRFLLQASQASIYPSFLLSLESHLPKLGLQSVVLETTYHNWNPKVGTTPWAYWIHNVWHLEDFNGSIESKYWDALGRAGLSFKGIVREYKGDLETHVPVLAVLASPRSGGKLTLETWREEWMELS